ncbi:dihydroxyacetone kinase subunit DhaL [compost metagenome]
MVGDKTLIDALVPCADSWSANTNKSFKENFVLGAQAAVKGAESTKEVVARMGRAGIVGDRSLGHPDAGAHGLGVIFTDIAEHLK